MSVINFRERVKFACLDQCLAMGCDENEMISLLHDAARQVRDVKTADAGSVISKLSLPPRLLFTAAIMGIPASAILAAGLAHAAGRTVKNVEIGRLPNAGDIRTLDDTAMYENAADEVERRIQRNEQEKQRKSLPSVRRMF